mgnify:CR=1 FL=1
MIYLRIINTKNLINADIQALVEALPFGDDEKKKFACQIHLGNE